MKPAELIKYVAAGTIIVLIVMLLVTQLVGQPFIVFVKTGSMEPTLQPNDGYVAVPAFFAGEIEKGDVILYKSQELGGGQLTTHRVVRETERGYITKGDANPFTDQAGDEPPVAEGQIKSVALEVEGNIVVIPGLGVTVTEISSTLDAFQVRLFESLGLEPPGVDTFSMGILVLGLVVFVYSLTGGGLEGHVRTRSTGSPLRSAIVVMAILTLVVIIPVNFSMLLPSGIYQIEIVSAVEPQDAQRVIQAGESSQVTYFMRNSGHIPVIVFLQPASDGVETPGEYTYVSRRTTVNRSVTIHAPNQTGTHLRFVREFRYLVLLPPSLIAALHNLHPLLALLAINVVVATAVMLVSLATIGTGRVRVRSRRRQITFEERLQQRLPVISIGRDPPSRERTERDPIYNWINRREHTESRSVDDRPRAGPAGIRRDIETGPEDQLGGRQLIDLYETLGNPPEAVGLDAPRWTPDLLQRYLDEEFGVTYSHAECVRLLDRARSSHGNTDT